ncbi:MAG: hypothetical protein JNM84_16930 [Planctomycetes bacterium]|jgi:anthranilate phosphoribosyltransferase|nr:hypothetical protein [Planctomycetota bacterium]
MILREFIKVLGTNRREGRNLTCEEAETAFARILEGEGSDVQVGAFLMAMRWKGETVDELVGFTRAARAMAKIPSTFLPDAVAIGSPHDGKRGSPPLNGPAGIVAAACGVPLLQVTDPAPPGSGRLTSADMLRALGAGWCDCPEHAEGQWNGLGYVALSARALLPGLDRLRLVRSELGVRVAVHTIEKLILPRSAAAVVGVHKGPNLGLAAEVLHQLGHERGFVVQGVEGGTDPFVSQTTQRVEIDGGRLIHSPMVPSDYGVDEAEEPQLEVADAAAAARLAEALLEGREFGPARSAMLLGAAQLLVAGRRASSLADGVDRARVAVDRGEARAKLQELRRAFRTGA